MDLKSVIPIIIIFGLFGLIIFSLALRTVRNKNAMVIERIIAAIVVLGMVGGTGYFITGKGYEMYVQANVEDFHVGEWRLTTDDYKIVGRIKFQKFPAIATLYFEKESIQTNYSIDYKSKVIDGYSINLDKVCDEEVEPQQGNIFSTYKPCSFNVNGVIKYENKDKAFIKLHSSGEKTEFSDFLEQSGNSFYLNRINDHYR